MKQHDHNRAFTLVELLIVTAVLSLLISILLPSLAAARKSSRRVNCLSNLRHVSLAWNMYLDEYNDRFPPRQGNININYGGRQGATPFFQSSKPLNTYLGLPAVTDTAEVFRCPADKGGVGASGTYFDYYGTSYRTNIMLVGSSRLSFPPTDPCADVRKEINTRLSSVARSNIASESRLILVGDAGWERELRPWSSKRIEWHDEPQMHNIGFMDGHAEFVHIRKGLHVTADYVVIPFADLQQQALSCQQEIMPGS